MKSQNTKSSDELKREVHQELRNVRRDLDEITDSLSPGAILDRAVFSRHGGSLRNNYEHLKNNPIGASFLTLGTILLMEDEYKETYETRLHNQFVDLRGQAQLQAKNVSGKVDDFKERVQDIRETIQSRSASVKGAVQDKVSGIQDKVSGIKEKLQHKGEAVAERTDEWKSEVSEKVTELKSKAQAAVSPSDYENWRSAADESHMDVVKDKISSVKNKISSEFSHGKDVISNMDPSAYMILGASLGALTGAALPVSDAEKNFVSDKMGDGLSQFETDLKSALNECSGLLKDLVLDDVKNYKFNIL